MKQNPPPKIELRNLTFGYDAREGPVLDDISLDVGDREFLTVVGPSGCGKSTMLRIIACLQHPDAGTVTVAGRRPETPGPDRAMVFQEDAVFPWLTVGGNVEYGLRCRGESRAASAATADAYLRLVGLDDARDRYPRELSGGMRKRVDLARAMAIRPDVLLMDEPFAALDVITKQQLQVEFLRLWTEQSMTVVFVTHDLEEALFLSDRVAVMAPKPGRIVRIVDVPFARPREPEIRTAADFQHLRGELSDELQQYIGGRAA